MVNGVRPSSSVTGGVCGDDGVAFEMNWAGGRLSSKGSRSAQTGSWLARGDACFDAITLSRALLTCVFVSYVATVLLSVLGARPLGSRVLSLSLLALGLLAGALVFWRAPSAQAASERSRHQTTDAVERIGTLALAGGLLASLAVLVFALLLPVGAYDALGYRLPAVAQWLDAGAVSWVSGDDPLRNGYPLGLEVIAALLFRGFDSPRAVDAPAIVLVLAGAASLIGYARELGVSRGAARLAGGLFLLVPMHLLNAPSGYADAAFAGALVVLLVAAGRMSSTPLLSRWQAADLGCAAALVIALKPHGFALAGLVLLGAFGVRARSHGAWSSLRVLAQVSALALPGLFFALRNVVRTRNPLYPLEVRIGSRVLLEGEASLEGILTPDYNVPRELLNVPHVLRPLWVWLQPHGPATSFDDRLAGFGYAFVLLGLPALVWLLVSGRKLGALRGGLGLVLALTGLCWLIQPMAFWPRFSSWIWGAAALALALLVHTLQQRGARSQALGVALSASSLAVLEALFAIAHVKGFDQLGRALFERDAVSVLARVAGVDAGFVRRALVGKRDVCRTPWRLGTDDANLDGVVAQLSPRPRMHIVEEERWSALASTLRALGCEQLIAIGDPKFLSSAPPAWAARIEAVTAFGSCQLISIPSAEVSP
jgi:hypothetical protein